MKEFEDIAIDKIMYDLLCSEIESQCKILIHGLMELERDSDIKKPLESVMRAAHSIKGAARVVNLKSIVHLTHTVEDKITTMQKMEESPTTAQIESMLQAADFLSQLAKVPIEELNAWIKEHLSLIDRLVDEINGKQSTQKMPEKEMIQPPTPQKKADRVLRMTAHNLNRIMGLAGESLVESRWLYPFSDNLQNMKKRLYSLRKTFDQLRISLKNVILPSSSDQHLQEVQTDLNTIQNQLNVQINELHSFTHHYAHLSDRLYNEVIQSRMRPFSDGVESLPRFVRDLAIQLGKEAHLQIEGKSTLIDREILEKLETPLTHLLRNAIDHGIESPSEREKQGKSREGTLILEAHQQAGMLSITLSDDGKGIDLEKIKKLIVEKKLVDSASAALLTESEITDFLFAPAFSTATKISEISGRGIGLDIVRNFVQQVGGKVWITFEPKKGTTFHLLLPLALSLIQSLVVEVSSEIFAFPLARISHTEIIDYKEIVTDKEGIGFQYNEEWIPLFFAHELLALNPSMNTPKKCYIILLEDRLKKVGLIVDRFFSEKTLSVHEIDARLGKIMYINSSSIMEDGRPVFIIEVEDVVKAISFKMKHKERMKPPKKVLVVDDSLTIRQMLYQMLKKNGYVVDTAVNGIDGWNALYNKAYDIILSDVNMPRLDGIAFVKALKGDPQFQKIPVVMISYNEREADIAKGLDAGARFYLGKSTLNEEKLLNAVVDAIDLME
jgi:two-component system, chemotaxis family, sensor histidine kinase and response regulator WspE